MVDLVVEVVVPVSVVVVVVSASVVPSSSLVPSNRPSQYGRSRPSSRVVIVVGL